MSDSATQCVFFPELLKRPVQVQFDTPTTSVDGGAVLLAALDRKIGLTERLAAAIRDRRQPGKVAHGVLDLFRQRTFGIGCGYGDCNDAKPLRQDPIQKLLLARDPRLGRGLADQATLSRFENGVDSRDLYRVASELTDVVIEQHHKRRPGRRVKLITIDLDPTEDRTHGEQQLSLFNGHYDAWCYLPLLAFVTFDKEPEQQLVAAILRGGRAPATQGAVGLLRRLLPRLRRKFPHARLRVRLDGGFSSPEILSFLEQEQVEYLVAIGRNPVLSRLAEPLMQRVRRLTEKSGQSEAAFDETRYAAKSWKKLHRRVIMKAEVVRLGTCEPRDNARFVVTNLPHSPEIVYQIYRGRGDSENRIKELKNDLEMDRTSCTRFLANQFRVLLTAAAFVLFQQMRLRLARCTNERPTVGTMRLRLIKIAARVETSVRRVVLHLAQSHPWAEQWRLLARSCGAAPG